MLYRKIILAVAGSIAGIIAMAQDGERDAPKKGFKQERIFIGASLGLGAGTGFFNVSGNPEIGYSITNWLDAGLSTNINYTSIKAEYNNGYRQRSTVYGGGAFVRIHPIRSIFLQVLPEYNWINTNLRYFQAGVPDIKVKEKATSILAGIGYGSHFVGQSSFFTAIMVDLGNDASSPYINTYIDGNGNVAKSKIPVVRAGFNFYLRPKREK